MSGATSSAKRLSDAEFGLSNGRTTANFISGIDKT
jgi:hypothetical protein